MTTSSRDTGVEVEQNTAHERTRHENTTTQHEKAAWLTLPVLDGLLHSVDGVERGHIQGDGPTLQCPNGIVQEGLKQRERRKRGLSKRTQRQQHARTPKTERDAREMKACNTILTPLQGSN